MNHATRFVLNLAAVGLCLAPHVTAGGRRVVDRRSSVTVSVTLADLLEQPDRYVGRRIRLEGRILDVCPRAGRWAEISDESGNAIRFSSSGGEVVFEPRDVLRRVLVEGIVRRRDLTRVEAVDRARYLAGKTGRPFDPRTIDGPQTVYELQGVSAEVR